MSNTIVAVSYLLDYRRRSLPQPVVLPGPIEAGHNMAHRTTPLPWLRSPGGLRSPGPGTPWSAQSLARLTHPGSSTCVDRRAPWLGVRGLSLHGGASLLHLLQLGLC